MRNMPIKKEVLDSFIVATEAAVFTSIPIFLN